MKFLLDPRIKEILILFVLSNDYYQLLVQERAKKAFKFNKVKKWFLLNFGI